MRRYSLAVCGIMLALVMPLYAQAIVRDVVVGGESALPRERLLPLALGKPVDSALITIANLYSGLGYLDVDVVHADSGVIRVEQGRRYHYNRVSVSGSDSILGLLVDQIGQVRLIEGSWAESDRVDAAARVLLARLSELGYGLAALTPTLTLHADAFQADVILTIEEGVRVRISSVQVSGNTSTRTSLIRTAVSIPSGTLLTEDLLDVVRRRVERLGLFSHVGPITLARIDSSGEYDLRIRVVEASVNTFDGVLGIQPSNSSGGTPAILGQVSISLGNIFGSGRRLALRWSRQSGVGSRLDLRYTEPFVLNLPMDVDVGYQQSQLDETPTLLSYVRRGLSGGATYGVTDAFRVRLGGALDWTIPQPDSSTSCDRQVVGTRLAEATVAIAYDTRSDRTNPVSGLLYGTSYAFGSRSLTGQSECDTIFPDIVARQRIELDFEGYVPVVRRAGGEGAAGSMVAALGIHYRQTSADQFEDGDLYRLGGVSTVRGYREWAFSGSRVAWSNLELRVLLSSQSYAAVLVDGGYYSRPSDPRRPLISQADDWIVGYGVGAQIETPLGLARVAYALGKGDTFVTGKISFGLVNQF